MLQSSWVGIFDNQSNSRRCHVGAWHTSSLLAKGEREVELRDLRLFLTQNRQCLASTPVPTAHFAYRSVHRFNGNRDKAMSFCQSGEGFAPDKIFVCIG
mmetsp:Transcript_17368/g.48425  ORF Transcript_17368/g.48425 Transcript_17368/m.48425 type:complete len:99 (+) Transcript_17368:189-485(+)